MGDKVNNYANCALELLEADDFYNQSYHMHQQATEQENIEHEGLIYLFKEWLNLVSPADFGNDEGLEGVFA